MQNASAIIAGGGESSRMGFDKLWADLGGRPLVAWPLLTLVNCASIDQVILVVAGTALSRAQELIRELRVPAQVAVGGATRSASVRAGLELARGEWVVVHDAARPLVTAELVKRGLAAAQETGAAVAAVPVVDTVKRIAEGRVIATLDRRELWAAQTPQVFRRELLVQAHRRGSDDATDDAGLVEALGVTVRVYEGAYANIKVTTPVDLQFAASLLSERGEPGPARS